MDCKGFKSWLLARDDCDERTALRAHDHRANCPGCDRLYSADEALERAFADGIHPADVPGGMARRARARTEAKTRPDAGSWTVGWPKALAPALALGVALVFMVWNPWANPLITLDAIGSYALANHNRNDMTMAFKAGEIPDPPDWFYQRLNFRIAMPDFSHRQLKFLGGRECTIGPKKAAYLFYDGNGEHVSVFIIPARQIKIPLQADRRYTIDAPRHHVELWKMDAMVCILVQDRPTGPSSTA